MDSLRRTGRYDSGLRAERGQIEVQIDELSARMQGFRQESTAGSAVHVDRQPSNAQNCSVTKTADYLYGSTGAQYNNVTHHDVSWVNQTLHESTRVSAPQASVSYDRSVGISSNVYDYDAALKQSNDTANYAGAAYSGYEIGSSYSFDVNAIVGGPADVLCGCGMPAPLRTARTEKNFGQQFYTCNKAKDDPTCCNFFQWQDENRNTFADGASGNSAVEQVRDHNEEIFTVFGHKEFRQGQRECIEAALHGRDVFCLMPTGGGKSMVYQVYYATSRCKTNRQS